MIAIGSRVRSVVDLVADDGWLLDAGVIGHVVGYQAERLVMGPDGIFDHREGERLIVTFEDLENGTQHTATVERWEVRPA